MDSIARNPTIQLFNDILTPALIGDRLILRTDKHLYSIRNARGN